MYMNDAKPKVAQKAHRLLEDMDVLIYSDLMAGRSESALKMIAKRNALAKWIDSAL